MAADEHTQPPVRHVVLFAFRDDAQPDRIRVIEWGTNESPEGLSQGFTHCFLVTLEHAAARDAYLPHPAHVAFTRSLEPVLDRVLVVDFVARD